MSATIDRPVVVTGAAGFVGAHVLRAMVAAGRPVVGTDVAHQPPHQALRGVATDRLRWVAGDLREQQTRDELIAAGDGPPTDVVHVAARIALGQLGPSLGESSATPAAALASFEVNAVATWRLCAAFAEAGVLGRFVQVSTRSVFGARPASASRITEDSPPQAAGVYGSSKAAAETGLLALRSQFDLDLVVARITGVFGPWQGPASFIGRAMEAVLADRPHRTDTGADDAYELTYVKDTVRGLLLLADAEHLRHAVYHVASGDRLVPLHEVAAAYRAADPRADVEFGPGAHSAALGRTPLDVSRMAAELGFSTRWTLATAIADYLRIERTGEYGAEAVDPPGEV